MDKKEVVGFLHRQNKIMKTYSKKQIIRQLIISGVLAVATLIIMLITKVWDFSTASIGYTLIMMVGMFTLLPFSYMSWFYVHWKKAIIGMVAPIPVLSYTICMFKGMGFAFLALIALIKGEEEYTFNKYGVDDAE